MEKRTHCTLFIDETIHYNYKISKMFMKLKKKIIKILIIFLLKRLFLHIKNVVL